MTDDQIRKIEDLRDDLTARLDELHRRALHAKDVLTPSTYWQRPWVRVGTLIAAGGLGVALAVHQHRERKQVRGKINGKGGPHLLRMAAQSLLATVAATLVKRALQPHHA